MRFTIVTILPELCHSAFSAGVVGRAKDAGHIAVDFVNPRDFTTDRHRTVDDTPYGGGPGMVMKPEPLLAAIESVKTQGAHCVALTPSGQPLTQARVKQLAALPHLIFVAGRYEGIDQRVLDLAVDEEISIGDFVLSGGELGALVVIDAVARLVPGVLGDASSSEDESFSDGLLEYPQYTRPAELPVADTTHVAPAILSSGNHAAIADWRLAQSMQRTALRRPELWRRYAARLDKKKRKLLASWPVLDVAARTYVALVHHPVVDRTGAVVTTALTNLDLHDIARSCTTFGCAGFFVVTPVDSQREKAAAIGDVWRTSLPNEDRAQALRSVQVAATIEAAMAAIAERHGQPPHVVATSANPDAFAARPHVDSPALHAQATHDSSARPLLILFGTGFGLYEAQLPFVQTVLQPIMGPKPWNHLSVRSAVAVTLDRLFGFEAIKVNDSNS